MKFFKNFPLFFCLIFITLMLFFPTVGKNATANAVLLCGRVIIPSLFPFSVCALYLTKSNFGSILKRFSKQKGEIIFTVLLSMLGGYPIGARLVKELYSKGKLTKENSQRLVCCCVNAGPAFIIIAVGNGIFNNQKIGYILFISHILASLVPILLTLPFLKTENTTKISVYEDQPFVSAAADASAAMISICAFVIFFSTLNAYINLFANDFEILNDISSLTEVTNGIINGKNVYKTSFLLGFGGFSVWFQIFASCKDTGIKIKQFVIFRILHGSLSTVFTYISIKIFKPYTPTVSNHRFFNAQGHYSGIAVSVSLFIMLILLILTLFTKNRGRKILDDLI